MRTHRAIVTFLVACMAGSAMADPGMNDSDAGTGTDAGNTRAAAMSVASGITYGGRVRGSDIDWYMSNVAATGPSCVRTTGSADSASYFALGVENNAGTTSAPILLGEGVEAVGGVAGQTPLTSTLRIARASESGGAGMYSFRFERFGVPPSGDAGTGDDVGNADFALPIAPGCIGGHLSAIGSLDMRDVYAVSVAPGQKVTYSLASNTGGHTLSLLNAAGETVGPILESGQLGSVALSTGGTYYLTAQRTTAIGDVGYIAGVIVGPEPTGCRPYCLE